MEIRPYIPEDAAAVREVHRRAFDGSEEEPFLVELLHRAKAASVSLVAVMVSQVVGHILFSPVVVDGRSGLRMVGLAPVGVLPEYQGKGIGSRLLARDSRPAAMSATGPRSCWASQATIPGSALCGRASTGLETSMA